MTDLILGVHVDKASKVLDNKHVDEMDRAILRDLNKLGLNAAQIFTHNPRSGIASKMNYEQVKKATSDIDLTVHGTYTSVAIWKVTEENKKTEKSKSLLLQFTNQLKAVKEINAWCIVLHIIKLLPAQVVETMKILKPIAEKIGVKIALEMVANKADNKTYETPEKIDNLINLLGDADWYGFVIDTAHLWGAGIDCSDYKMMHKWLNSLKHKNKIIMFHLNGSYADRGSGKDKHAIAFSSEDKIWHGIKPESSGVKAIVEFAKAHKNTIICEINRGTEKEVIQSLEIIKKM